MWCRSYQVWKREEKKNNLIIISIRCCSFTFQIIILRCLSFLCILVSVVCLLSFSSHEKHVCLVVFSCYLFYTISCRSSHILFNIFVFWHPDWHKEANNIYKYTVWSFVHFSYYQNDDLSFLFLAFHS